MSLRVFSYCFHHGIDPHFSENGRTFSPSSSNYWQQTVALVSHLLCYPLVYLHPSREERHLRQLILEASQAERDWHYFTAEGCLQTVARPDSFILVEAYEHAFCERIGKIAQKLFPEAVNENRPFPSELLRPLHALKAPKESSDTPKAIRSSPEKHPENTILSRMDYLGFCRFRKSSFATNPKLFQTHYISHQAFIEETKKARKALIQAFRTLRLTFQSPLRLLFDRTTLIEKLKVFHGAWKAYQASHEILEELSPIFETKDHYAPYYQAAHTIRHGHVYFVSSFRPEIQSRVSFPYLIFYDRLCSLFHSHDLLGWHVNKQEFTLSNDPDVQNKHTKVLEKGQTLQDEGTLSVTQTILEKAPASKTAETLSFISEKA